VIGRVVSNSATIVASMRSTIGYAAMTPTTA
jgi:hypothetical protein